MAHERMSQYTEQGRFNEEQNERGGGRMHEAYGRVQETVGEHPGYSALVCFGVGVGVGAALTLLLAPHKEEKQRWYHDYLPDENFTREMSDQVRDTVARVLPEAIGKYVKRR